MELGVLGYILTLGNLRALGGPKYQVKDISVHIEAVSTLEQILMTYPGFSVENFKYSALQRHEDTAILVSATVRNYLSGVNKNPDEEGLMIILKYEPRQEPKSDYLDPAKQEAIHFLLPNADLARELTRTLLKYADDTHKKISSY